MRGVSQVIEIITVNMPSEDAQWFHELARGWGGALNSRQILMIPRNERIRVVHRKRHVTVTKCRRDRLLGRIQYVVQFGQD